MIISASVKCMLYYYCCMLLYSKKDTILWGIFNVACPRLTRWWIQRQVRTPGPHVGAEAQGSNHGPPTGARVPLWLCVNISSFFKLFIISDPDTFTHGMVYSQSNFSHEKHHKLIIKVLFWIFVRKDNRHLQAGLPAFNLSEHLNHDEITWKRWLTWPHAHLSPAKS